MEPPDDQLPGPERLFREHGDRIHRIARGILNQEADAEDATQEVLLRILDKGHTFRGRARFTTWVYRLTVNHCLNRRRRPRATVPLEEDPEGGPLCAPEDGPLERASRREWRDHVHSWLARLDPDARAVLALRELEELSYAEIGDVLQVPVGTVMSRLARARDKLAAAWRPPGVKEMTR